MAHRMLKKNYGQTCRPFLLQVAGAEKVLYGHDDAAGQPEVIIVEGEMDKLALEVAGYSAVLSVPDGAPARVRLPRMAARWLGHE